MAVVGSAFLGLTAGVLVSWSFVAQQVQALRERLAAKERREAEGQARREAELQQETRARAEAQALRQEAEALRQQAEALRQQIDVLGKQAEIEAREAALRARQEAAAILQQARADGEEQAQRLRAEAQAQAQAEQEKLRALEAERSRALVARIERREAALDERERSLLDRERALVGREFELEQRKAECKRREADAGEREGKIREREGEAVRLVDEQRARLEALAGMSGEEARKRLMDRFLGDARRAAAREAKVIEDAAREEAERRAKRVIGIAIQRYAGDHAQDRAVSTVHLPSDELKGRIIGREGRNIRALQEATGVDFIIDDTPESIVISSFDPIRREVARSALERLIADGRIHPTRIEEAVAQASRDVERITHEAASRVIDELGLAGLHPELQRLLGQLRFRYSYAQNVLKHSLECGYLTGLMAGELGLSVSAARRAGLLHDLGKAVSHEVEGGHALVGARLARKHGEDEMIAAAIGSHHDDEPCSSVIGHLVAASDALSSARPGARREALEGYVKRLGDLERIASAYAGVERSYAIQAGREVRVIVEPSEVSDAEAALLAQEISRHIEEELVYPGQIRVTVVRETRAVDYAK